MSGRKRSSSFAITLTHVDFDKTCFGSWCVNGGLSKRICVAEEVHHPPLDPISAELMQEVPEKHHHIYVEFEEKYFLPEVRDLIIEFLCGDDSRSINVQVRSYSNILL